MKKHLLSLSVYVLILAMSLLVIGCSAASYRDASVANVPSYAPRNYEKSMPKGDRLERSSDSLTEADEAEPQPEGEVDDEAGEEGADQSEPTVRMVIYQGNMQIQVVQPADALQRLTSIAKERGGFVERTNFTDGGRQVVVVLRVPVARFFDVMDQLPALGTVLGRSIRANDVTAEFADVENRLKSSRLLKERLERLLASVKNVDEKVKILRELNRITTEIEMLSARSKELSDRASFSTIVVQLSTQPRSTMNPEQRSPFPVLRDLNPAQRTIDKRSAMKPTKPEGFFDNEKEFADGGAHQFYSPDGTVLRSGEVQNRPTGDAAFWKKALQIECQRRSYKELQSMAVTDGHLFVYRIHDGLNVYYYGIAFRVTGKKIQIFEAFSPSEDAFKMDGARMIDFLKSVGGPL